MAFFGTLIFLAAAIIILFFMIAVHELGHYLAGKTLGFKIKEFALGMGKVLFKRTNKKTGEVFTIRAIPLGGFCSFYGDDDLESKTVGKRNWDENGTEKQDPDKKELGFNDHAPWKRLIVLFAGGFFNFLSAILFAIVLLMIIGYNQFIGVGTVKDTSQSGLQSGDIIHSVSIDDGEFQSFRLLNSFQAVIAQCNEDSEIVFKYERDGVINYTAPFNLTPTGTDNKLEIGIGELSTIKAPIGFFDIIWKSILFCAEIAWIILVFLWGLITGQVSLSGVGGPVATVSVMTQSLSNSLLNIFLLVPMISVNLGLFNLLPLPALDGSRMVFVGIEWARGKPINPEIEGRIHFFGILVLFGLVILADMNYIIGGLRFIINCCLLL